MVQWEALVLIQMFNYIVIIMIIKCINNNDELVKSLLLLHQCRRELRRSVL